MSFFESFIGGAADAGAGILSTQMKEEADLKRQKEMAQFNAELAEQKQKALLQLQSEYQQQQAQKVTDLVGKNAQSKADGRINTNYSADDVAPEVTGGEDRSEIDREVNRAKNLQNIAKDGIISSIAQDPMERARAANQLGQLSDKELVGLDQRETTLANQQAALEGRLSHLQQQEKLGQLTQEQRNEMWQLRGKVSELTEKDRKEHWDAQDTAKKDHDAAYEKLTTKIRESRGNLKQMIESGEVVIDRKTGLPTGSRADEYKETIDALRSMTKKLNATPEKFPDAAPATAGGLPVQTTATQNAAPSGLPAGAVQIGIKNGKPVYQTPNGKKFTTN